MVRLAFMFKECEGRTKLNLQGLGGITLNGQATALKRPILREGGHNHMPTRFTALNTAATYACRSAALVRK